MPVNTTNGFDAAAAGRRQPRPELKLDRLFDRLPPHSTESEMSLLGSLLLDPRMIADVVSIVTTPDAFYHERHATIYRLIVELGDKHSTCDVVQLVDTLRDRGQLEGIGGQEYLVELASGVPSAVNARHYARVVADKHRLRRLIEAAGHMLYDAFHAGHLGPEGVGEVLDRSEQSLFEIAHEPGTNDPQSLDAILQSEMDRLEAIESQGGLTGLPSGFADLDALLSGLHPGEMLILAARPSMGKCLAADSEIVLPDGAVETIESICHAGRGTVPTLGGDLKLGRAEPSAFVDDGLKPVFEVTTRLGRRVVTTLTHPFLTIDGWTPLADLREGDRIAVPRRIEAFGSGVMRECEVKLLAYLIGGGGLTGTCPRFTNGNPRIADEFASAVAEFGGLALRRSGTRVGETPSWSVAADRAASHEARGRFARRLREAAERRGVTSRAIASAVGVSPATLTHWTQGRTAPSASHALRLCEFLEVTPNWLCPDGVGELRTNQPNALARRLTELGLMGHGAAGKHVPAPVFRLRRDLIALFLNRLFSTDGWATVLASGRARLGYSTVSERLARQVQHLLLRFGVIASLRQRWVKYRESRRVSWQLDITDARSIRAFADSVGIFGKEASVHAALGAVAARRYQTNRDLIPVGVWKRIDEARGGLSWREVARRSGIEGDSLHVGVRAPTRDRLARIARGLGDAGLARLAESDVYWDEIVSIEPAGVRQVYDLTVPGTHNFVANDICVHNTALALNLAEQIALGGPPHAPRNPKRAAVAIFSLEMSRSSLAQRLISARSGLDLQRLRTGDLRSTDWETLTRVCGELHDAPIYIDDTPALTVLQLRARARRMAAQFGVRAIVIDYLQLLTAPGAARESRQVEVAAISRGIKALARELDLPVVCLAQLNRSSEHREGNRPRMADLRESGSIEQDADVVLLLHREEYYHRGDEEWEQNNPDKVNLAELIVAKQRNGPTGLVKLTWDSRATRFKDHDPYHTANDGYESVSHAARGPAPEPKPRGPAAYAPGARTGPVENFRDGGGPEAFDDDTVPDDEPPF